MYNELHVYEGMSKAHLLCNVSSHYCHSQDWYENYGFPIASVKTNVSLQYNYSEAVNYDL